MGLKVFFAVFGMVFLAELGDKTQLATFLMASDGSTSKWVVFAGAAFALVLSSFLAVIFGEAFGRFLSPKYLKIVAGAVFLVMGVVTIYSGVYTTSVSTAIANEQTSKEVE